MKMLGALIVGHALADYPLQGDFLAKAKNRTAPIAGVPWWQALSAHAIIHGGIVAYVTKRPMLGVAEAIVHAITDDLKCRGKLTFNQDQAIHAACKVLWAALARDRDRSPQGGDGVAGSVHDGPGLQGIAQPSATPPEVSS